MELGWIRLIDAVHGQLDYEHQHDKQHEEHREGVKDELRTDVDMEHVPEALLAGVFLVASVVGEEVHVSERVSVVSLVSVVVSNIVDPSDVVRHYNLNSFP